jgi:hypothetical protein
VEEVRVFWNLAHAETLPLRHAGSWERQYNGLGFGFVPTREKRRFAFVDSPQKREKAIESPKKWADRFTFHFSETDQY